jgi:phosphatidylcholine synthase
MLRARAYAVHLLTASGVIFAMLALLSAVEGAWSAMFFWLLVALVVDGVDGLFARRWDVAGLAGRIDGALLDLVIDYLTFVFIPVYALAAAGLVTGWGAWLVLGGVPLLSALYFADTRMKTPDGSFEGFPGCWNMIALWAFAVAPPQWALLALMAILAPAMFLPLRFVHPMRTSRWRAATLAASVAWLALGLWALAGGFALPGWAQAAFTAASAYLVFAGVVQQAWPGGARPSEGGDGR